MTYLTSSCSIYRRVFDCGSTYIPKPVNESSSIFVSRKNQKVTTRCNFLGPRLSRRGEGGEREGGVCAVREGGKVHTENDDEGHFDGLDLGLRNDTMRDATALTSIRSGVHQDTAGRRTAVSTRRTCAHQPAPRAALSIW